ncbi:unnamed protein product [Onchocerca flexuosa]|uniref:Transmembrane protein n=1 Tax=Onchocerca flexuosa TaxID=387005 RepID=A0A183HCE6_9BILA|nr:unnamed protein product [Onchocerca flexuosa]
MLLTIVSLFFISWSPAIKADKVITNASTVQQPGLEEFWISANLLNIEWKPNCLIITYCNKPELKMIKTNHINGEKSSFSWQLDENLKQLSNSAFISYWTEGSPLDIEMNIEIIGVDPKYRFQRSCDQTVATKAFEYEVQEAHSRNLNSGNSSSLGQMIVELQGRCFDVTLTVQKHIGRCPWCMKIETTVTTSAIEPSENGFSLTKQYSLIVCVCIVTSCLITICILQWIFNRYEKSKKSFMRKATISPVMQSTNWKIMKIEKSDSLLIDRSTRKSDSVIPRET